MENQQVQEAPKKSNKTIIWIIVAIVLLITLCGLCGLIGAGVFLVRNYIANNNVEGQFCGGIANIQCPEGYVCNSTAMYPDAGGTCTKDPGVEPTEITNFQECLDAGGVVMESYPRQCRSEDGQTFVEQITINEKPELFTISGTVNFPSEVMPPMQVCAYDVLDDANYTCTEDIIKKGNVYSYSLSLPQGDYYVDAEVMDGTEYVGIYSEYAKCFLEATDAATCVNASHEEVPVKVGPNSGSVNYGPVDWYYE